jgi:hypothetical protein
MGRGAMCWPALWFPNPEISALIKVLTPWVGGWDNENLHRHCMAYSKGYRICIGSVRLVRCARLSDVPCNNM